MTCFVPAAQLGTRIPAALQRQRGSEGRGELQLQYELSDKNPKGSH